MTRETCKNCNGSGQTHSGRHPEELMDCPVCNRPDNEPTIRCKYPTDMKMVALMDSDKRTRFKEWLEELDGLMIEYGNPYGEGAAADTTGLKCWFGFFDDDYCPRSALDEDQSID